MCGLTYRPRVLAGQCPLGFNFYIKNEGMLELKRVDSDDLDFRKLVAMLDIELAERDGEDNAFYSQFNSLDAIRSAVLAYAEGQAIACGAIKYFEEGVREVKRMFVLPAHRGKGVAKQVLAALEAWALEQGSTRCVLETGKRQPEAIRLYAKCGYSQIPNYGQYIGVDNSVCFEKILMS